MVGRPSRIIGREMTRAVGRMHVAALVALICLPLGFEARADIMTCTATIADIKQSPSEMKIVLTPRNGCREVMYILLRSSAPPECVAGRTVTATGAYLTREVSTLFGDLAELYLDDVTDITCQ